MQLLIHSDLILKRDIKTEVQILYMYIIYQQIIKAWFEVTLGFASFCFLCRITVGVELLRKMGWKEGQGIGPRVKRKPCGQKPGKFREVPELINFLVSRKLILVD